MVGKENAGALIYLSGENGTSSFRKHPANLVMYGSLVVNGQVDIIAGVAGAMIMRGRKAAGPLAALWRRQFSVVGGAI